MHGLRLSIVSLEFQKDKGLEKAENIIFASEGLNPGCSREARGCFSHHESGSISKSGDNISNELSQRLRETRERRQEWEMCEEKGTR